MTPRTKKLFWFLIGCMVGSGVTIGVAALFHHYMQAESKPSPPAPPQPAKNFTADPDCPKFPAADPDWLVTAGDPPLKKNSKLPVPSSLKKRVEFWGQLWSKLPNRLYLLVDSRHPWIVHGRADCRKLFSSEVATAQEETRCDRRIISAKRKVVRKLRRHRRRPGKALVKAFGNSRRLAKTAYRNVTVLEGRKQDLERGLERARPYLHEVERVFEKSGLPPVLAHVAFIESLFEPEVESSAGAVGAYQFVEGTARQYLMIGNGIDERLDPVRESWAAACYLKELHTTFRSWPLALTAYNTGPSRMRRVIRRRRTRDIGKLANMGDYGNFGFDGQNYYAQFIAVSRLTKDTESKPPAPTMVVKVTRTMPLEKLAGCLNTSREQLVYANPAFTRAIHRGEAQIPQGYLLSVPSNHNKKIR